MRPFLRSHYQTIVPNVFQRRPVTYRRERLELDDGDFLDLDWKDHVERRLVVLSHGLEGDSRRAYVASAANYFHDRGWNVLAWNCRSCSGEMNRTPKLYSHGQSEDLGYVVEHAVRSRRFARVELIGYSMGGNLTLKYLGTAGADVPEQVTHGVAFSAPCHIQHSADSLDRRGNYVYRRKFMKSLYAKISAKERQFPGRVDVRKIKDVRVWRDFDRWFSAPIGGYDDLAEYYAYLSSANFVAGTRVPVLICNAKNDPIVPPACTPRELAGHPMIHIAEPGWGGHVGFGLRRGTGYTYMDVVAGEFFGF